LEERIYYLAEGHYRNGRHLRLQINKLKQNVDCANKLMEWHNDGGIMILSYDMFRNLSNDTGNRLRKKIIISDLRRGIFVEKREDVNFKENDETASIASCLSDWNAFAEQFERM